MALEWLNELERGAVRELWMALNKAIATVKLCTDYWPDEERVLATLERWRRGE